MKMRFPVISLTGAQIRHGEDIATFRVESKIRAGRETEEKNVLRNPEGFRRQHRTGAICEVGVALYGGLPLPDKEMERRKGVDAWAYDSWDLPLPDGKTIDTKGTTSRLDFLQIFPHEESKKCDFYVRCWLAGNRVVLVGYQTHEFVWEWARTHELRVPPEFYGTENAKASWQIPIEELYHVDEILLTPEGEPIGHVEESGREVGG